MDFLSLIPSNVVGSILGGTVSNIAINYLTHHFGNKQQFNKAKNDLIMKKFEAPAENLSSLEIAKCKNILEIAKIADDLRVLDSGSNIEFSFEWFNRFFESASMISDESIQTLWAKILNGEAETKGKYSYRFIESMRLLSKNEAEIFLKISRLTIQDASAGLYIYAPDSDEQLKLYESFNIGDAEFLLLEECGLINMSVAASHTISLIEKEYNGFYNEFVFVHLYEHKSSSVKIFEFNSYSLTRFGKQLYELIEEPTDKEFILGLAKTIQTQFKNDISISAYKMIQIEDDEGGLELDLELDLINPK